MKVFLGRLRGYFKLLIISSLCLQDQLRGDFYCGLTPALSPVVAFQQSAGVPYSRFHLAGP